VSFDQPLYTVETDALGTLHLLEAVRNLPKPSRFYQASSSEMYGLVAETPQSEKTPFHPRSPYGCAKVFSFYQVQNYRESYGLFACNGILFNHESPRRGETFVTRKITRAATRIKLGLQEKLFLGNLDAKRDDYVVATGETYSVKEFLEETFRLLDLDWKKYVEIDQRYFRPSEVDLLLGDSAKARKALGWKPKVGFKALVRMMVETDVVLAENERILKDAHAAPGQTERVSLKKLIDEERK
jgi:GDPmannose 4,6-dehydratase